MNPTRLDEQHQQTMNDVLDTLSAKAAEYAREDRFHNFRRAAAILRCTPERALMGMATKHLVSILDIVDALDDPRPGIPTHAYLQEKFGDAIAYLLLLKSLLQERIP